MFARLSLFLWSALLVCSNGRRIRSRLGSSDLRASRFDQYDNYHSNARADERNHYSMVDMEMEEAGSSGTAVKPYKRIGVWSIALGLFLGTSSAFNPGANLNQRGVAFMGGSGGLVHSGKADYNPVGALWSSVSSENNDPDEIKFAGQNIAGNMQDEAPSKLSEEERKELTDAVMGKVMAEVNELFLNGLSDTITDELKEEQKSGQPADKEAGTADRVAEKVEKRVRETANRLKEQVDTPWVDELIETSIERMKEARTRQNELAAERGERSKKIVGQLQEEQEEIRDFVKQTVDKIVTRLEPKLQEQAERSAAETTRMVERIVDRIIAGVQVVEGAEATREEIQKSWMKMREENKKKMREQMRKKSDEIKEALEKVGEGNPNAWANFKERVRTSPMAKVMDELKAKRADRKKKKGGSNGDDPEDNLTAAKRLDRLQDDLLFTRWMRKQNSMQKRYSNDEW